MSILNTQSQRNFIHWLSHGPERVNNRKSFRLHSVFVTLSNCIKIRSKSFIRQFFEILYPWRVEKEIELMKAITLWKHPNSKKKFRVYAVSFALRNGQKTYMSQESVSPP